MTDSEKKNEFLALVEENQDIIHKICGVYAWNDHERWDLRQEILYQLWKAFDSFRKDSKFTTWMYRVALNTALLRMRNRRGEMPVERLSEHRENIRAKTPMPEETEEIKRLYKAINGLREFDRAIVLLYLEEVSYREIGEITGISEGNVSVRLVRIKKKLREMLNREAESNGYGK